MPLIVIYNLTVWQNIYVFNQRTRGTNVLLLNNDTIIISGGYGDNFPNTIVVKLDQLGNFISVRQTSDSRGGLVPGGYVINPANDIIITGEGIIDNSGNNRDVTILRINTTNLTVIATRVMGLPGAAKDEIGRKILPYKQDTFIVGYRGIDNNRFYIGIAKVRVSGSSITYVSSLSLPINIDYHFGGLDIVNDSAILIGNGSDGNTYIYLINLQNYGILLNSRLNNTKINDVKFYNGRFYLTGMHNNDVYLAKLDRNLNLIQSCLFTPTSMTNNIDEAMRLFIENDRVIMIGNTNSFGDGYETFILVTDTLCSSIIAQSRYGTPSDDIIYDAYKSALSIVAVGESYNVSPVSIYAIRIEGTLYLSCSEKPVGFTINSASSLNNNFTYNTSSISDKGNANFDFTSSSPLLINKIIICTPVSYDENKNCLMFNITKNGIFVKGNGIIEIYQIDGKFLLRREINGSEFIKLKRGVYIINRRKIVIN
ncbi:MAG: hypothetical protein ABIL52_04345 [candidate division WOR-3 bacterium]